MYNIYSFNVFVSIYLKCETYLKKSALYFVSWFLPQSPVTSKHVKISLNYRV